MTTIATTAASLLIRPEGLDKMWALKGSLEIPLGDVVSVATGSADLAPRGIRAPGTAVPGRYWAGTWRGKAGKEFWIVRDKTKAVVVELTGNDYTRVVVEVADQDAVVAAVRAAMAAARGSVPPA